MVSIDKLTFRYNKKDYRPAVSDITGRIAEGIVLLLGENGAGKTTLLRLIAGKLIPQEGTVDLHPGNPASRMPSVLNRLFFVGDDMTIPSRDIVTFARDFGILYPNFSAETLSSNLEEFGLTGTERFDSLSLGNRHKTLIAFALALGVDLLLLDEPANGLDITSKASLRRMMARCVGPDQTVLISTHTVADLHELYDGVMVMSKGRLLLSVSTYEVASRLAFTVSDIPPREALFFEQRAGRFHSVTPLPPGSEPVTETDYSLLYSALLSPKADEIITLLTKNDD
ncbi:MAG: ATP-binding cassette domain-containing protein [Duncaniella sp.]|nr:ATP-binding cassette domain-containing protein [Duncaniella sp.]